MFIDVGGIQGHLRKTMHILVVNNPHPCLTWTPISLIVCIFSLWVLGFIIKLMFLCWKDDSAKTDGFLVEAWSAQHTSDMPTKPPSLCLLLANGSSSSRLCVREWSSLPGRACTDAGIVVWIDRVIVSTIMSLLLAAVTEMLCSTRGFVWADCHFGNIPDCSLCTSWTVADHCMHTKADVNVRTRCSTAPVWLDVTMQGHSEYSNLQVSEKYHQITCVFTDGRRCLGTSHK